MKKIYAILASFVFLAVAGTVSAASPAIQLTGYTPVSNNQVKLEAFYSLGDAQSLDLYFYWDNICGVFNNQSSVYRVSNTSGYISYNVNVPQSGTYCYKVSGMAHYSNGTSDFIDSGSPSSKEFKTLNSGNNQNNVTTPSVQNTGATSVTSNSALLNAYYNSGNASASYIYFMYGPASQGAIYKSSEITRSLLNGDVATTVTGLNSGTSYVYRAYIRTSYGTVNATNTGTFTTLGGNNNTNTCTISNFYADSSSIAYGSSTTLRWNTNNCSSASITNFGTVSTNDTRSTGSLYSNTTYTLNVWGNNGSDSRNVTVSVGSNNNNNNYPSCYYNYTCYWNGSIWVAYNNNNNNSYNNQPSCYYSNQCYWNGYSWVTYSNNYYPNNNVNTTNNYPSCYYSAQCYWSGTTWIWNTGGNVNGNYDAYSYNPHTPYTGGPNYIYRNITVPGDVVYVNEPTNVYGYNYNDIMYRYNPDYRYIDTINRNNLVGAVGTTGQITLIGLLIALIIIAIIVYVVKSSQEK